MVGLNKLAVTACVVLLMSGPPAWGNSDDRGRALLAECDRIRRTASSASDLDKALAKCREALLIFEALSSESGKALALADEGLIYSIRGRYKDALEAYNSALNAARRSGDLKAEIVALRRIGTLQRARSQYREARKSYGEALALARRAGDADQEAEILNGEGAVLQATGKGADALRLFRRALAIKKRLGDIGGQGTILNNMASVYRSKARYGEALETYEEALSLRKGAGDVMGEGVTLDNIGVTHGALGHYAKALEYGEKSLAVRRKLGDARGEFVTLANIALVYYNTGRYRVASEYYNKALAAARNLGDPRSEGTILNNLGAIAKRSGRYERALTLYDKALALAGQIGSPAGEAVVMDNMAQVFDAYGRYDKALELHTKALAMKRKTGDTRGEAVTLSNIALVYRNSGRLQESLSSYEEILERFRKIGDAKSEATTVMNVGNVCENLGRYHEALQYYLKGFQMCRRLNIPTGRAEDLIGNLHLQLGAMDEAERYLKRSGRLSSLGLLNLVKGDLPAAGHYYGKLLIATEKSGNVDGLFAAYTGLGKVHEGRGDYAKAEEYYEKGLQITEDMRASLPPAQRKTFFSVKTRGFFRSEPAKGLTRVRMKLNKPVESIDASEAIKARSFADAISVRSDIGYAGVPSEILDREEHLVTQMAHLKSALAATSRDKDPERFDRLTEEIAAAEKDQKVFIEELWQRHRAYAGVKYPRPVPLKDAELGPDEHCVFFDVLGDGVGVKLIRGKDIVKSLYVECSAGDLERDVALFRRPFETLEFRDFDPDLGKRLYDKLLAPVLSDVPRGTKLVLIPDGVLSVLPFEALVVSGWVNWTERAWGACPEGVEYLGDVYPIVYHQSLTALTLMRTLRRKPVERDRILVLADPVFRATEERAQAVQATQVGEWEKSFYPVLMTAMQMTGLGRLSFERLEETGELARSLENLYGKTGTIWTGLKANKRDFLNLPAPQLDRYAWIVFATHGVLSMRIPGMTEPFLTLTLVPVGTDGFLKMSEVMGLKLNAEMVALTACQTGLGRELEGEGIMSMGRAFQYAGARSVLMSLWSVAERSSVIQAESLFRTLKEGSTKLEALRHSRRVVRDAGFDHPFFWASFVLVGEAD